VHGSWAVPESLHTNEFPNVVLVCTEYECVPLCVPGCVGEMGREN
jgi:hypothetical protein